MEQREIKFRGMDLQGRWHYGLLAIVTAKGSDPKPGHYISNTVGMPFAYPVRPDSIGEFTSVRDKLRKDVYEGDVVQHINSMLLCRVVFSGGCFVAREIGGEFSFDILDEIEVVGNTIEHLELLK